MSLNTEKEGQEGQQTSDKLESKVLLIVQDKPLSLKQQQEKEQYLEPTVIELTPSIVPRTTSSCSYNRRNSSSFIEDNSFSLKQKFSKLSFSFNTSSVEWVLSRVVYLLHCTSAD